MKNTKLTFFLKVSYFKLSEDRKKSVLAFLFSVPLWGFESPCSSPSELAIRKKGTERLSGSRVIGYNCSALPWHFSGLAVAWTPSSLPSVFFFFFLACCWNESSEGLWLKVIWKGEIKRMVVPRCSMVAQLQIRQEVGPHRRVSVPTQARMGTKDQAFTVRTIQPGWQVVY